MVAKARIKTNGRAKSRESERTTRFLGGPRGDEYLARRFAEEGLFGKSEKESEKGGLLKERRHERKGASPQLMREAAKIRGEETSSPAEGIATIRSDGMDKQWNEGASTAIYCRSGNLQSIRSLGCLFPLVRTVRRPEMTRYMFLLLALSLGLALTGPSAVLSEAVEADTPFVTAASPSSKPSSSPLTVVTKVVDKAADKKAAKKKSG